MEIVLVIVVLLVIAAAVFVYMTGQRRSGGTGLARGRSGPSLRGTRGARRASRHDPMAVAVERHAQAIEPHEAAREEQNLQAQARRVAADLHARQAQQPEPYVPPADPDYPAEAPDDSAPRADPDYPARAADPRATRRRPR